jgi:hypothetical protein
MNLTLPITKQKMENASISSDAEDLLLTNSTRSKFKVNLSLLFRPKVSLKYPNKKPPIAKPETY